MVVYSYPIKLIPLKIQSMKYCDHENCTFTVFTSVQKTQRAPWFASMDEGDSPSDDSFGDSDTSQTPMIRGRATDPSPLRMKTMTTSMAARLQGMMKARWTAVTMKRIPLTLLLNLPLLCHNSKDQHLTHHRLNVQQIDLTVIIHTLSNKVHLELVVYTLQWISYIHGCFDCL